MACCTRLSFFAAAALAPVAIAGTNPPVLTVFPDSKFAMSVSDDGSVVVGSSDTLEGGGGWRWTPSTGVVFIGGTSHLPAGSGKVGVSGDGSTIGSDAFGADGIRRASKWIGGTDWINLATFGDSATLDGVQTSFHGIDDDGVTLVGLGWSLQGGALGRKWDSVNGNSTVSSLFPGTSTRLNGTNTDGSVVWGWNDTPSGTRRGIRRTGSVSTFITYTDPNNVTYFCGEALTANPSASIICGYNIFSSGLSAAWRWDASTGQTTVLPQLAGFGGSPLPSGVVADGSLILGTTGGPLPGRAAIMWVDGEASRLYDHLQKLGTIGLNDYTELGTPMAISPDGRFIVGFGFGPDGTPPGGWMIDLQPASPCLQDLDGDGAVGASDLAILLGAWGQCGLGDPCPADFNDDFQVGADDLAILLGAWGACE